jgi:hypothetical protein
MGALDGPDALPVATRRVIGGRPPVDKQREAETWERRVAGLAGLVLLFAGAASILIGKASAPTIVLLVVSAPLVYAGLGLPLPSISAAGARLNFGSTSTNSEAKKKSNLPPPE